MKYIKQFLILLGFTLLGELLNRLIPLPVPAAIYGIVLLFIALCTGTVKLEQVSDTAHFFISFMPLFLVTPTVNLLRYWNLIAPDLGSICIILAVTTVVTFSAAGVLTQLLRKGGDGNG